MPHNSSKKRGSADAKAPITGVNSLFVWGVIAALMGCLGWADNLEKLSATPIRITSLQTDFVQRKHLPILAKPLVSKGVMYFKAPQSLRWEYREPIQSVLIMHAGATRRFQNDGSGFQEESSANLASMQVIMDQITQWLSGRFDRDPLFTARMPQPRQVHLIPKEKAMSQIIDRIELHLARTPGVIESVLIHEGPEAFTRMDFSAPQINPHLTDDIFQKVP